MIYTVQPRILIATTTWWPLAARLAAEFGTLGAHVGAICPRGSPLLAVSSVREVFKYSALAPTHSVAAAARAMQPDLVVPCDERTLGHLHTLHASASSDEFLVQLIERSLGDPAGYSASRSRGESLELAAREGILEPATRILRSSADVRTWCAQRTLPAVMKADGSWGGAGVELVSDPNSAVAAYRRMSRPLATWRAAKFLLSNRDPFPLYGWLHRERHDVIGQDFVRGRAANIMAACWKGEVLATSGAVVLETAKEFGAATIIQMIRHDQMELAATRLVRRLGMSGFCGIDFIIEDGSDKAYMIELNPRATQLGHLSSGAHGSLAAAMLARLRGNNLASATQSQKQSQGQGQPNEKAVDHPQIAREMVAFFPQALLSDPASPLLRSAYHDIPWEEPALVAELLKRPWDGRSPLARLINFLMRRPDVERVLETSFARICPLTQDHEPIIQRCIADVSERLEQDIDTRAAVPRARLPTNPG